MRYLIKDYFHPLYQYLEMLKNGYLTINDVRIYSKEDLELIDFNKPYQMTFEIPYEEYRSIGNPYMIHHMRLMGERETSIYEIEKTNYDYMSCVNCDHPRIDHEKHIGKCNNEDWIDTYDDSYPVDCYKECEKFIPPSRAPINSSHN